MYQRACYSFFLEALGLTRARVTANGGVLRNSSLVRGMSYASGGIWCHGRASMRVLTGGACASVSKNCMSGQFSKIINSNFQKISFPPKHGNRV